MLFLTGKIVEHILIENINIFILCQKYSSKHVFELINSVNEAKMAHMNILVNDNKYQNTMGIVIITDMITDMRWRKN